MDIMTAIKRQAAMEVITDGSPDDGYLRWKCPACKEIYVTARGAYDFCPKCGQKLLWKHIDEK